eukprot:gene2664-3081_t
MIALFHHYHAVSPKYTKREICMLLRKDHGVDITERQLKYICQKEGLSKHWNIESNLIKEMVSNELDTCRRKVGYRQMSEIVNLRYSTRISKESVRKALKEVDPDGVEERRGRVLKRKIYETNGPNDVYHIDGNDKFKQWGFYIPVGVDGFSQKFAPRQIRMDFGTENIYCEDLQVFFTNDADSFRYGRSTANQRIEAYWSRLKKFRLYWWIQSFVEEARLWDIDPEEIQVSFDAVNLYPSVPIDKAITVIVDILNKDLDDLKTRTKLTLTDIHKLIELCLSICYFLYNDQIRVIKNAGPIGLSLMVVIAEAYLQHIELKAIKEALTAGVPPISFKRYVDDSHSRFKSKPESEQFLGILNKQDKAIQFTVEYETEEKSINFLDVKIMNAKTGKYQFDIHRKDAITNVQVKPDSDAIEEIPHHAVSLSPRTN